VNDRRLGTGLAPSPSCCGDRRARPQRDPLRRDPRSPPRSQARGLGIPGERFTQLRLSAARHSASTQPTRSHPTPPTAGRSRRWRRPTCDEKIVAAGGRALLRDRDSIKPVDVLHGPVPLELFLRRRSTCHLRSRPKVEPRDVPPHQPRRGPDRRLPRGPIATPAGSPPASTPTPASHLTGSSRRRMVDEVLSGRSAAKRSHHPLEAEDAWQLKLLTSQDRPTGPSSRRFHVLLDHKARGQRHPQARRTSPPWSAPLAA